MKKKFFITTPIYYVNDIPHVGTACTTVIADIIARYHRLAGEEVFFLTGTDEHGAKIAQSAKNVGKTPQEFCDEIAPKFEENWKKLDISHDYFIRTTNQGHEKVVSELILKIKENGYIYEDTYKGLYCVGCEAFKTPDEIVDGKCPEHPNRELEKYEEKNYFLALRKIIGEHPEVFEKLTYAYPENKRKEMLIKIAALESDVSISRANVDWGIPIPWDKSQTIYVWFDALINYYSATQFLEDKAKFWPADLHLVGKGINWFHSVIWQSMLLAAGLPLPKKIFAHSHLSVDGQKMSKSLGNVISPEELVAKFGVEASRFLIAKSFPANDDGDITWDQFGKTYNSDLANNLGNLVSRLSKLAEGLEINCQESLELLPEFGQLLDNQDPGGAIEYVFRKVIDPVNLLLNQETPWTKPFEDESRQDVLKKCIKEVVRAGYNLQVIMPKIGAEIIARLGSGKVVFKKEGLFPRI